MARKPPPEKSLIDGFDSRIKKFLWGKNQNKAKIIKIADITVEYLKKAIELEKMGVKSGQKDKNTALKEIQCLRQEIEKYNGIIDMLEMEDNPWPSPETADLKLTAKAIAQQAVVKPAKNIMIIEDEPIIIKSIAHFLIQTDYDVKFALTAREGLKKVLANKPDLILLDIMMPGMNGYQFLVEMKKMDAIKHIPVIILSSLSRESDILEGLEKGAVDYLTKPFSPHVLMSKIEKILASKN